MQLLFHYSACAHGLKYITVSMQVHSCVRSDRCTVHLCISGFVSTAADLWSGVFVLLIILRASASHRKVASTVTPPLSWRRWSWSRAPFTRRRRGWPRTGLETTARIHSLWVTSSSAQADKSHTELLVKLEWSQYNNSVLYRLISSIYIISDFI